MIDDESYNKLKCLPSFTYEIVSHSHKLIGQILHLVTSKVDTSQLNEISKHLKDH